MTKRHPGIVTGMQLLVARELDWCLYHLNYWFERTANEFTFYTDHGGERLVIIAECTGLYTSIIFFSIIAAYPARIREKLAGILIGIPAIHILNLIRMVVVSLVLYHRRELFDFFHGYLWQVTFVIFMLLIVIFWMAKIVKPRGKGEARP
jgi:archaeosortase B (VPXXXP-CTERM-specific)